MKVCVIGAGAAGLAAAKYSKDQGHNCTVYEQTENIGGVWNYTDLTGLDEDGLPIYSPMYKGLKTNLPKEVMFFMGYPHDSKLERSYLYQEEVLRYLHSYSEHFSLGNLIQFNERVVKVEPQTSNRWKVTVKNLKSKKFQEGVFDAILVCNGHYSEARIMRIPGQENFEGIIMHSRDYRSPELFKDKRVVVIGAGPSGLDISISISLLAKKVILSHHKEVAVPMPEGITKKGKLVEIFADEVLFSDGSREKVDFVLLCTGYLYSFPFLSEECGIQVDDNHVFPLYKHVFNVKRPTMGFIGLNFKLCPFPLFDIQVRFFLAFLEGKFQLPSEEKMLEDLNADMAERRAKGQSKKQAHMIGNAQGDYFDEMAKMAKVKPIPNVINKIYYRLIHKRLRDTSESFKIIDDENFIVFPS